jgi:hypothetical protein
MIKVVWGLAALFVSALEWGHAGGFATGNGGLSVACIESRYEDYQHTFFVHEARLFDLVRWPKSYIQFTQSQQALEHGLRVMSEVRPDLMDGLKEEVDRLQLFIAEHRRRYEEGYSMWLYDPTNDYPDRESFVYHCRNGQRAEVYQTARYVSPTNMKLAIEIYLALPPLDQGAFVLHEAIYQLATVQGQEPPTADPVMKIISAAFASAFGSDNLSEREAARKHLQDQIDKLIPFKGAHGSKVF